MDALEAIKQTYFQECEELLAAMEEGLLAIESGEADSEIINAVFRAVHSIKGGGGAFGFDSLVAFAHVFETAMDQVRSGQLEADANVAKILLRAGDILADHVNAARSGQPLDPDHDRSVKEDLARVANVDVEEEAAPADFEGLEFTPMQIVVDEPPASAAAAAGWKVRFAPHAILYEHANEPALIIRELTNLGPAEVVIDLSKLPNLHNIDPNGAYFAWDVALNADVPRQKVDEVFEFVMGDCDLAIEPLAPVQEEPVSQEPVAQEPAPAQPAVITAPAPRPEPAAEPVAAEKKSAAVASTPDGPVKQTIRVDPDKIDRLVNLVGELVITQAMLTQRVQESAIPSTSPVANGLVELEHLLRELQESVMAVRTQPVKSVFQRFPRLVRELSAQTGKQARLEVEGESTEVDKTVIERLAEPLTHMIRNAVDHGLESPEDRAAAGKPTEGTVKLSAEHRGGRIVIEIADDGRGINRERVKAKAIEKGLIAPNVNLSDEEIDNLIFLPGFSTASQVSNISGRGVGMDVVRRNVQELGGRVVISNYPGKGSCFSLTLPLTLAVLDGMVVSVGDQTFVVPLTHIIESLQPKPEDVRPFVGGKSLLHIRNTHVPLVHTGEVLGVPEAKASADPSKGVIILVESDRAGTFGLVVDSILGQRQVVIKSFEAHYERIEGIAAATIFGDGRVALIIDVDGLVSRQLNENEDRPRARTA
ncbi:MAG: chemotaxis protein CheA [Alphaproteobacteria bacterium]